MKRKGPILYVYLAAEEYALVKAAAERSLLTASMWARTVLLKSAAEAEPPNAAPRNTKQEAPHDAQA